LIAIRLNYHSANATEIVGTTLMATVIATLAALGADRWYRKRALKRPPNVHSGGKPLMKG
ncbi:nucleoside recognition protein, partial [Escherichia coli]|nr:nucleoside recognition protein [Escherichia coli]